MPSLPLRLGALALLAAPSLAHIALVHPSMFGWDPSDPNQSDFVTPLMHLPFDQWWFHGYKGQPPQDGVFMELQAGGSFDAQLACNKALTQFGAVPAQQTGLYACDGDDPSKGGIGAMHTADEWGTEHPKDVKGTALAIAYTSDQNSVQPEDFTVISTNYESPWFKNVSYQIPADLPACPEGGCLVSWSWYHAVDAGSQQMFHLVYRAKVNGASNTIPLPKPLAPRKCPVDKSNCTVGGKQPIYWYQAERNNVFSDQYDPPFYNEDYGFTNGAQTDLYVNVDLSSASAAPSSSASERPSQSAPAELAASSASVQSERPSQSAPPALATPTANAAAGSGSDRPSQVASSSLATAGNASNATALPASSTASSAAASTTTTKGKCMRRRSERIRRVRRSSRGLPRAEVPLERATAGSPDNKTWAQLTHQEKELAWRRASTGEAALGHAIERKRYTL